MNHYSPSSRGFTLIELMVVVAIMGILSVMVIPSYQDRVIRTQVGEGLNLSEFVRQAVQEYHRKNHRLPADNAALGLPASSLIVGNYVSEISVRDGVVLITYGNRVNRFIAGKRLSLRPAIVDGYPVVPIAWVCGNASVPEKMQVRGHNDTDLPAPHLPLDCRM
ncbi:MAG: pilus assembly protein PilA [Proteobacteria bacterium]|nr:pilus assembly protein PilA [Pseudomonadota bacterium]MBS1230939.1 pilus assembly protein PilA [Pseudomonadota bacterium]